MAYVPLPQAHEEGRTYGYFPSLGDHRYGFLVWVALGALIIIFSGGYPDRWTLKSTINVILVWGLPIFLIVMHLLGLRQVVRIIVGNDSITTIDRLKRQESFAWEELAEVTQAGTWNPFRHTTFSVRKTNGDIAFTFTIGMDDWKGLLKDLSMHLNVPPIAFI